MKTLLSLALLSACAVCADTTVICGRTVLRLSDSAVPLSLVLIADGTECLNRFHKEPLAEIQTSDGVWLPATSLRESKRALVLGFSGTDTTLTLTVETPPDWIALRVAAFGGTRPKAVRFVKLDSAFTETVGKRLNIGWNNAHALCVMAASPLTDTQVQGQTLVTLEQTVAAVKRGEAGVNPRVCLTAAAQDAPGPQMEGAAAVIIACPTPDFKKVARGVAHAYGLLTNETADGTPVKDTELARGSAFFIDAGLRDTDRLIRTCAATGLRQVVLPSPSWCSPASRTAINTENFPNGLNDLKAFVSRLKAAGLTVGLECPAAELHPAPTQDATCRTLADIYNACGFGMVCFDSGAAVGAAGSDDAITRFQEQALRQLNRPVLHTGTTMTHRLWHSVARVSTVDTYLDTLGKAALAGLPPEKWPTVKEHIDTGVAALLSLRRDMMPGELGRFGVWPRLKSRGCVVEGLQLDEIEYLLSRSVAYDCPVSLQTSFGDLDRNPLTPEILRLVKLYETARLSRRFTEADKAPLREQGKEFTLLQRRGFPSVLVPVRPVACCNDRDVRAMVGTFERGSVATFWCAAGSANLTLDLSPFIVRLADFDDQRVVALKNAADRLVLPISARRLTLFCPTLNAAVLEQKIKNSLSTKTP